MSAFTPAAFQSMHGARWDKRSKQVVTEIDQDALHPAYTENAEILFDLPPAINFTVDSKPKGRVSKQAPMDSAMDEGTSGSKASESYMDTNSMVEFDPEVLDTVADRSALQI